MKRLAVAVALLIGLATPSQADYQDGQAAYSRGDYATALQAFKPLAEQGDATLIEAKAEYAEMARARLREDAGMFAEVQPA